MNWAWLRDFLYPALVLGLFIVPRVLQRYRIPSAITCIALGALLGMTGLGDLRADPAVPLLSTLGIVSLFLFAGLEVNFAELRQGSRVLGSHLIVKALVLGLAALGATAAFGLDWRAGALVSLAWFTPSAGFILDSLPSLGFGPTQAFWVRSKAIASELLALAALFVVVQSASVERFLGTSAALAALIWVLPRAFHVFAARVLPFAPKSEFAFLLIMALVAATVTRKLGVYYLVGAFIVGVTAVRLRERLPALSSERLAHGVELFASFFIPFYFFRVGLHLEASDFSPAAIGLGVLFAVVLVPLRILLVVVHRGRTMGEDARESARIAVALVPTLVFTIVLAGIAREHFGLPAYLYGAMLVFTLLNTLVPAFVLRGPAPEFDTPEVPWPTVNETPGPGPRLPE